MNATNEVLQSRGQDPEVKMIKCPGCDLCLPEHDFSAQIAHMNAYHPEIIVKRLEEL